jgi:hypothetical protein
MRILIVAEIYSAELQFRTTPILSSNLESFYIRY